MAVWIPGCLRRTGLRIDDDDEDRRGCSCLLSSSYTLSIKSHSIIFPVPAFIRDYTIDTYHVLTSLLSITYIVFTLFPAFVV